MNPRSRSRSTLFIALAVQVAVVLVSVFIMVREDALVEPPAFSGERVVSVARPEEKRLDRVREMSRRISKPRSFQRLAVEQAFQNELPSMPALPQDALDLNSVEDSMLADAHASLSGSGLMDLASSLAGKESAAEFFGVRDSGRRIVIVVNTSASVVRKASARGVSIERLQQEAIALVEGLGSGTLFGIVQFSQGTKSFSEFMAPALVKNKVAAAEWVRSELKGNPKVLPGSLVGHEAAVAAAMALQPDLIFLVTDGSLNRRTAKPGGGYSYPKISFAELMDFADRQVMQRGVKPRLHVVGFELGEVEREGLERLARRFNGSLREM
ncbi:hypothetical protein IEN85_03820 [Pelagicoccus sp. NFK12]|uniref:VWFA domain-containing protein n=1 Tax=Pelagicoccus enzymogenes TaxID=2773457 RepID=A0A927IGA8_9BACT|nr:hypothetical protein [Pelagicoccus enzymogenes]MBD5778604.1 hypothetical protein [Pelagicoccus enzymogenes]